MKNSFWVDPKYIGNHSREYQGIGSLSFNYVNHLYLSLKRSLIAGTPFLLIAPLSIVGN